MLGGETQDALIIGDQRAGEFDRGSDEQPIRRVTVFELVKSVAAGSGAMAKRHSFDARTFQETRDPPFDGKIQFDPPDIDEQRNLPNTDSTQANGPAILPASIDQSMSRRPQAIVAAVKPEADMRVEQE